MSVKLNVGFSRKTGEANYGSRGASVGLEVELDASLVDQVEDLHARIRQLFQLAETAVDVQLKSTLPEPGAHGCNGSRNGRQRSLPLRRPATSAQVHALLAIAESQGVDLAALLRSRFGFEQAHLLSRVDASRLIDELKSLRD